MTRRQLLTSGLALVVALAAAPALARAADGVPVHVRVIKGSRQGPAHMDPGLEALKRQLGKLAYVNWTQQEEQTLELVLGKTTFVTLPDGEHVGLTLQDQRGKSVTLEFALAQRNAQSRLTIEKGQRIVHQVSGEKNGAAFFLTVLAQ